ncbi:MAG: TIGR02147 family protein [Fibrobacteres bacterium]|nr:TIGR02147 family protein [Fibrobacterota bacterium]
MNIHDYSNFRDYLRDLLLFYKKKDKNFTYRLFAKQAGISSSGFLKEVVDGKKNLGRDYALRFAEGFKMNKKDTEYFIAMVQFNQSKSESEKNTHYSRMKQLQTISSAGKKLEAYQYEYYSDWYNSAIRELAGTKDFRPDPEWIAKKLTPSITPAEARRSLDRLIKLGLLKSIETGQLVQDSPVLTIEPDISTLAIRNFNRSMINLGKEAIENIPQSEREISGATLHISSSKFTEMKEIIRDFKEKLIALSTTDSEPAEKVYQFNVQFFPLSCGKETL